MSESGDSLGIPKPWNGDDDPQQSQGSKSVSALADANPNSVRVLQNNEVDAISQGTPSACNTTTAITYQYLTFDTPLPLPNITIRSSTASSQEPPSDLDLRPFTNPVQWSVQRKAYHLVLCCIATLLTAYCAGSYSPPAKFMEAELHASRIAVVSGITTFCTGFAMAPMVLAPFSEINGRYPVFAASGVIFVVFQIVCGLVDNLAGMLIARFIVGVGGSVFSTMIGGVIADLWEKDGRNTPMAIFSGSVLVGTGLGPMVSAVMVYRFGDDAEKWKWVFWHQAIMGGVLMVLMVIFFKESRGSVVLSRKATALNKWYEAREEAGFCGVWLKDPAADDSTSTGYSDTTGPEDEEKRATSRPPKAGSVVEMQLVRLRWRVKTDEERASLGKMISISVYRPFHLLVTEPVVFSFSLWVSFAWAVLYLTFSSVPYVYETVYGWNIEMAGYIFGAMIIGALLSTVIGICQDELLKHPQWRADSWAFDDSSYEEGQSATTRSGFYAILHRHFPAEAPESRLYFTCITATLLPIGLFMFGFTSTRDIHWILPAIAICLATMGIYSIYLATFNYLADVYHMYASSALAAQSCCRNILGGIFPLVTLPLFKNLGNAGAGALLGGIALGLTFVPWVLVFFGPKIRARSKFAVNLEKAN
ncbi:hypothetical protein N0V93_002925 [Gnomoniopsis smithogilvyi]|uniref:Major facilitator superfamily (MFS) profile domain-containing protein n=1 Tax=Gnomoniopsis smithogilvyi TaxID=1191159 RepID=A0A9W8YZR5_9PEZI|nr:hypothetical protein N0V93_002925 [Gnomoniopsis smithogilvyi]